MQDNTTPAVDPQEKLKEQAQEGVKQNAYYMKKAIDSDNFTEALQFAAGMINELRTHLLSPKTYYEIYMQVCDELRVLEDFLIQESKKRPLYEMYQVVQFCSNALPRLYLMITVGSAYIRSKDLPAKYILNDLLDFSKAIQHPLKGLFVRDYLSRMTKSKLPDKGNEYENEGDGTKQSVIFILENFIEMNKLWVRMQDQVPSHLKEQREKERQDIKLLVGTNLVRISQLDGVDIEMYSQVVLPKILDQVVNCRDRLAQQYLMEVLIQVFPDEMHVETLSPYLEACTKLVPEVSINGLFVAMADRLSKFSKNISPQQLENSEIFDTFITHVDKLIKSGSDGQRKFDLKEILNLQASLLNFAIQCFPNRSNYVDLVLAASIESISITTSSTSSTTQQIDPNCKKIVLQLLTLPVTSTKDLLQVLEFENYTKLLTFLDSSKRSDVALSFLENIFNNKTKISDISTLQKLFKFISPLITPNSEENQEEEEEDDDFLEKQNYVSKVVHLLHSDSTDELYEMYLLARKVYGQGGAKRVVHTVPSLLFSVLRLSLRIHKEAKEDSKVTVKNVFKFVHDTLGKFSNISPLLAFKLYLHSAIIASQCNWENIVYEFLTQAMGVFEEHLGSDSKVQFNCIQLIVGALSAIKILDPENRDTLTTKTAQYSSKLLKRQDQARALALVAHVFWGEAENDPKDEKKCSECLQRALNCAKESLSSNSANAIVLVEILNTYLYFFSKKNSLTTAAQASKLISMIKSQLESEPDEATQLLFKNTCDHIRLSVEQHEEDGANFSEIEL